MMTPGATTISNENRASARAFESRETFVSSEQIARRAEGRSTLPWTLAMIAVGLATLAACVLIPLREENRRLAHELAKLSGEADFVRAQAQANSDFIARVNNDPALAERLAMRATRRPAAGKQFLDAEPVGSFSSSPYAITRVAAPVEPAAYHSDLPAPVIGVLGDSRSRVILMAASLFLVAGAVVVGRPAERSTVESQTTVNDI